MEPELQLTQFYYAFNGILQALRAEAAEKSLMKSPINLFVIRIQI